MGSGISDPDTLSEGPISVMLMRDARCGTEFAYRTLVTILMTSCDYLLNPDGSSGGVTHDR